MISQSCKSLSVIIPNYNGVKLIPKFMPSVIKAFNSYAGKKELIVVDDASPDHSVRELKKFPEIHLIVHQRNMGFSGACNSGISAAKNEILFFLNTDVELTKDFFSYFSTHFEHDDIFAVTPMGFHFRTREPLDGGKLARWRMGFPRFTENYYLDEKTGLKPPYLSQSVQGAYFFANREKVKQLGGFDLIYSPFIFEETDLAYRALKRGWKIHFEPDCKAYHDHSQTIVSVAKKHKLKQLSHRNRLIFVWKNITSGKLLATHAIFTFLKLAFCNYHFWRGFLSACTLIPEIRIRRAMEKREARMSDEQLFALK